MARETEYRSERLLKGILAVLVRNGPDGPRTLREQIATLSDIGLRPIEIAEILGRSLNHITKELSGLRSRKRG
jgi:hypothetical protein